MKTIQDVLDKMKNLRDNFRPTAMHGDVRAGRSQADVLDFLEKAVLILEDYTKLFDKATAEIARLRSAICNALETANHRWSEWGDRAISVVEILDQALDTNS
jgi:hypothetical protein